jgi:GNAT superfamily N-acetyltransferase
VEQVLDKPWSVRPATTRADAEQCLALLRSASSQVVGPLGRISWTHPRVAALVASDAAAGRLYAVKGGAALLATFAICKEPDDYFATVVWEEPDAPARYLHRLAVDPALHGGGVGSWALHQAESIAAGEGARYLRLDALHKDERVVRFYGRLGYAGRGVVWVDSDERAQPKIPLACLERAISVR